MPASDLHIPSETNECQLLLDTANGDQAAFTQLLRAYWQKVYAQALTYLKSAEQAREVTQDVFIKVWANRGKLAEVESFSSYLFIISRNHVISELRKKKHLSEIPDELEETLSLRPDEALQYKESYNRILRLMDQLPPQRKKVFTMSRLQGKTYDEIAAEMGITRNTVKNHIIHALNYLRSHLLTDEEKIILLIISVIAIGE